MKEITATCNTCGDKVYFWSEELWEAGEEISELLCLGCGNTVTATVD